MGGRKIIDAEYEVVSPAPGRSKPWWRRLYIVGGWRTVGIAAALAILGSIKIWLTGSLLG